MSPSDPGTLDAIADRLYGLHPDAFVPARDDAVAEARQEGDRDLARAIGRLRRPTRAAWLANLLARERPDQLDGLLALAGDLASAQRTLDGSALRALSAQRTRLVTAMARQGGRLAAQAGDSATESVVRELAGILEAALADPAGADEVRSGRLTRTVSYSGFGPGPGSAGGRINTDLPKSPVIAFLGLAIPERVLATVVESVGGVSVKFAAAHPKAFGSFDRADAAFAGSGGVGYSHKLCSVAGVNGSGGSAAERKVLLDAIHLGRIHQRGGAERTSSFGALALQQVPFTGAGAHHLAGGGDFEPLGH
jgi:hypothetical protein